MTNPLTCKTCGGWGTLCLCPKHPGKTWTSDNTRPVCSICTIPLQIGEKTYTRDDGQRVHSDCLLRLAESHGYHAQAVEIQKRDIAYDRAKTTGLN